MVAENSGIEQLSDLAGKTVGVQAASAALDLLQSEEEGGQKALADTFGSLNEFAVPRKDIQIPDFLKRR